MARALTPSESEALTRSGGLLRFAAENNKDLPQAVVSTICAAWDAEKANSWDQRIATDFWLAFNSLCTLIKPVTMDTLSTNMDEIPPPKWKFWKKNPKALSLSARSAERYLILLLSLLGVAVILGFLVSTATNLSSQIQKLIDSGADLTDKMASETDPLASAIGRSAFSDVEAKHQKAITLLRSQEQQLYYINAQMLQKTQIMTRLISFGFTVPAFTPGDLTPSKDIAAIREEFRNFYDIRQWAASYLLRASIGAGVITSSILPIVLGIMGACAYVVRAISVQIANTTFSKTSPVRHMVRVALGGLAGVVIGFGGVVASPGSLSPSALAFIAGYAVEPVFATFDSIAEKFRR